MLNATYCINSGDGAEESSTNALRASRQSSVPSTATNVDGLHTLQVDRDSARLGGEVEDELFELFLQLNASDSQMDFPILYASAKAGICTG